MDVARYGDYATLAYTNAKVQENYRRRFRITFPNEELPAARPLLTTPIHDRLTAANAVWGATVRARARPVVPEARARAEGGRHLPAVERLGVRRRGGRGRPRAGRDDRDLQLRQVPGHRPRRRGLAVVAAHRADAGARPDHADRDAQRRRPDRRRVHRRPGDRRRRVLPLRVAAGRGPSLALVPPPPAGRRLGPVRGARAGLVGLSVAGPRVARRPRRRSRRTSTSRPRRSRS